MAKHEWREESFEGTAPSGFRHCLACGVGKTVQNQNEECWGVLPAGLPSLDSQVQIWYGTGHDLPMGPISAVVKGHIGLGAKDLLEVMIIEESWLRRHGLEQWCVTAKVYHEVHPIAEDGYGWFSVPLPQWQGIPGPDGEVLTFNLEGVTKFKLTTTTETRLQRPMYEVGSDTPLSAFELSAFEWKLSEACKTPEGRTRISMMLHEQIRSRLPREPFMPIQQVPDEVLLPARMTKLIEDAFAANLSGEQIQDLFWRSYLAFCKVPYKELTPEESAAAWAREEEISVRAPYAVQMGNKPRLGMGALGAAIDTEMLKEIHDAATLLQNETSREGSVPLAQKEDTDDDDV